MKTEWHIDPQIYIRSGFVPDKASVLKAKALGDDSQIALYLHFKLPEESLGFCIIVQIRYTISEDCKAFRSERKQRQRTGCWA